MIVFCVVCRLCIVDLIRDYAVSLLFYLNCATRLLRPSSHVRTSAYVLFFRLNSIFFSVMFVLFFVTPACSAAVIEIHKCALSMLYCDSLAVFFFYGEQNTRYKIAQ